ncbi:MAG: LysR family transcriptional regulator [Pseudonocardiaceae bacterium]
MELRQLAYFVAVADEANFTRAAAKVHVAQPGVSAQIRRLERELGQDLFDRSGRTVRLTEAGVAVLPYARAALAAVASAQLAVDELTGLMRGHVTIGTVTSMSEDIGLPGLLAGFHTDHPAVEIGLEVANTDDLIEALHAGRLDMAFVGLGTTTPLGIETHVVSREPLVAVVSHTDTLAATTTVTLKALADRALISLPRGTGLRACLDDACATAGFQPHIAFEASDPRVLTQLAAQGLGTAIVPRSVAHSHRQHVHTIAITRPALWGKLLRET